MRWHSAAFSSLLLVLLVLLIPPLCFGAKKKRKHARPAHSARCAVCDWLVTHL
eukprot:COSAG01_NODE_18992_length_1038_cov_5.683706_1_plen_52_part_01